MFPTSVGMNRIADVMFSVIVSVPHVRGDEPPIFVLVLMQLGVPHVRGDEPHLNKTEADDDMCSPRPWG